MFPEELDKLVTNYHDVCQKVTLHLAGVLERGDVPSGAELVQNVASLVRETGREGAADDAALIESWAYGVSDSDALNGLFAAVSFGASIGSVPAWNGDEDGYDVSRAKPDAIIEDLKRQMEEAVTSRRGMGM